MPKLIFKGKVYPLIAKTNFPEVDINWGTDDLGFPMNMQAVVHDSEIEVVCEIPNYDPAYTSKLLHRAYNLVEGCLDLAAFGHGLATWVVLESVVKPDGTEDAIIRQDHKLASLCTAIRFPPRNNIENFEFTKTLRLVFTEPELLASLRDLAEILLHPEVAPTNCGRVLDSLRKAVAPNIEKKKGWTILRGIVNADENYMNWVSVISTEPRHGHRTFEIPGRSVAEIRARTWNVTNRFIEFRKGGSVELDRAKFPLLVHDPSFDLPKP